jgi:hypothetical protein
MSVGIDDAVIARNDQQSPSSYGDGFNLGDGKAKVSGKAHAEFLVLDSLWESPDLRLEDMGRRSPVYRPPPATVGQASQQELLLDAGQRNSDPTAHTQRGGLEVADELSQLVLFEGFGRGRRGGWRCRIGVGLNDDCSGAIPTYGPDKAVSVIGPKVEVFGNCAPSVSLRQETVEEGAGDTLREALGSNGQSH